MRDGFRYILVSVVLIALAVCGVALAGGGNDGHDHHGTTTTNVSSVLPPTTVTVTVQTPGPAGPPGATGATGPAGPAGAAAPGTDLCPNWDGVQLKPPKGTVGTLNPRGQFVCVKFSQAAAWHPRK